MVPIHFTIVLSRTLIIAFIQQKAYPMVETK